MAGSPGPATAPHVPHPSRRPFSGVDPARVRPYIWVGAGLLGVAAVASLHDPDALNGFGIAFVLMVVAGIGLELSVRSGPVVDASDDGDDGPGQESLTGDRD